MRSWIHSSRSSSCIQCDKCTKKIMIKETIIIPCLGTPLVSTRFGIIYCHEWSVQHGGKWVPKRNLASGARFGVSIIHFQARYCLHHYSNEERRDATALTHGMWSSESDHPSGFPDTDDLSSGDFQVES